MKKLITLLIAIGLGMSAFGGSASIEADTPFDSKFQSISVPSYANVFMEVEAEGNYSWAGVFLNGGILIDVDSYGSYNYNSDYRYSSGGNFEIEIYNLGGWARSSINW